MCDCFAVLSAPDAVIATLRAGPCIKRFDVVGHVVGNRAVGGLSCQMITHFLPGDVFTRRETCTLYRTDFR